MNEACKHKVFQRRRTFWALKRIEGLEFCVGRMGKK
jgi:hypothetical protein